ncbi:zinc ribbon domain-containing protein (plasmid) [Streptomyces sp. NBC_01324]|uniref:NADase-type glycan-binding domain-containing protein n=1 Tax=Streptomyces sp. NBC_01324 TaxID=2903826 RepID=UPI002E0F2758|nr:zinc ribbon domain-containing protein [Streptomyces sp. NBC_01324]
MRACPTCGASNGSADDFCGNCGAYLGWSDTEPAPSTPPANTQAPPERLTAPAPAEPTPAQTAAAPGTTPSPPTPSPPTRPSATTPPAPAPAPAPVASPAPAPPAPEASAQDPVLPVLPAKPVAPRPVVRPVAAPEEAAGEPCPSCETPNLPGRRFCRRCAAPLHPEEKPAPLPWWRTVWPFRRRARASSGRVVRGLVILAVLLALCAGGLLLLPAGRALFEDTKDKMGKPKAVTPVAIAASAEIPRHPAKNTTDGLNNRYWGAPGPEASVTYTFSKPFRLVDLLITNGASKSPEEYARQGRALRMDLEVTTQDGDKHTKQVTLSDKAGSQTVSTGISDVKTVRLVLSSPAGLTKGRHLALAEVEFFQRS